MCAYDWQGRSAFTPVRHHITVEVAEHERIACQCQRVLIQPKDFRFRIGDLVFIASSAHKALVRRVSGVLEEDAGLVSGFVAVSLEVL